MIFAGWYLYRELWKKEAYSIIREGNEDEVLEEITYKLKSRISFKAIYNLFDDHS